MNTGGIAHGGYLATIADAGMGTAAHMIAKGKRCKNNNLDLVQYHRILGDKLTGKGKNTKKTNSLIFIDCQINNSKGVVTTASGTWKILL